MTKIVVEITNRTSRSCTMNRLQKMNKVKSTGTYTNRRWRGARGVLFWDRMAASRLMRTRMGSYRIQLVKRPVSRMVLASSQALGQYIITHFLFSKFLTANDQKQTTSSAIHQFIYYSCEREYKISQTYNAKYFYWFSTITPCSHWKFNTLIC